MADQERTCRNCRHCGWDPDGNYCAAPAVMKDNLIGLSLESNRPGGKLQKLCPTPEHPLFEPKKEKTSEA